MCANKTPEPEYTVLQSDQSIEIRQYPLLIVAQVTKTGERYPALNAGFRQLADYIFGYNQSRRKIAMTAPVMQQGMQITMAAPVTQQISNGDWLVRFVMPTEFDLSSLPKPNDEAVKLLVVPARKYMVIRFSGANTDKNIQAHLQTLLNYILKKRLKTIGTPIMAFYNPPWILPFLRRNEIMIELADAD
jgi:effector-binding domain-containing protein